MSSKPTQPLIVTSSDPEGQALNVKAWKTEYKGVAHRVFIKTIDQLNHDRQRYPCDNIGTVLQSSGMGKSRMLDEASKTVFMLPFNLRAVQETSAFPLPDKAVRRFMLRSSGEDLNLVKSYYLNFFAVLFTTVKEEVLKIQARHNPTTHEELAHWWYQELNKAGFRNKLYQGVCDQASKCPEWSRKTRSERDAWLRFSKDQAIKTLSDLLKVIPPRVLEKPFITGQTFQGPVQMIIYFDESYDLFGTRSEKVESRGHHNDELGNEKQTRSAYQILCDVLGVLSSQPVFAVFLSTYCKLADFTPSRQYFGTDRMQLDHRGQEANMQPPFVELPFDVFANIREGQIKLSDVSSMDHLVKFGRPLFYTYYHAEPRSAEIRNKILSFAVDKLYCKRMDQHQFATGDLAAAAVRVMLEFKTQRKQSRDLNVDLVAGHMQIAFSVPAHREYLLSGYPSEPVLAEAAALILNTPFRSGLRSYGRLLPVISINLDKGFIDKGERGELAARIILTLAHDKCLNPPEESQRQSLTREIEPRFSQAIPLVQFFGSLVGKANFEKILNALPNNVSDGLPFSKAFETAKVNFTHFAKGGDSSILTDKVAWVALARCMAWQCANDQDLVDILVPILLWDEKLSRDVVSCIMIQVKNRQHKTRVVIDADKLGFFTSSKDSKAPRPYITLYMELGVSGKKATPPNPQAKARTPSKKVSITTAGHPLLKRGSTRQNTGKVRHPRYAITINGCSESVYGVIDDQYDRVLFASLLTSKNVLDEHPYQGPENIDAALALKTDWSEASKSFHFVDLAEGGNVDKTDVDEDVVEEGVRIDETISDDDDDDEAMMDVHDV
ncbi:hypothetical protein GALMADRAFT_633519 [Galerina marginata CBS 339.88]|uniref:Uncharacterized protein n=1 Tax=Galerina marginata (strain CBS 339.88) TaxID=685588 RepID=A0A067T455_GALM3|nr:hypothetical protein GALMADRAFT_633519 [Galerina marginata CBS 339.88]